MALKILTITALRDPAWLALPALSWEIGDSIDIDIGDYVDGAFDTISPVTGNDPLPQGVLLQDGRYIRGTVTHSFSPVSLRFEVHRGTASIMSDTLVITEEISVSTDEYIVGYVGDTVGFIDDLVAVVNE